MIASPRGGLVASAALCILLAGCGTVPTSVERMLSIHADIVLTEEGVLRVREEITVQSTGARMKHGISRVFPTEYTDGDGRRHLFLIDGYAASAEAIQAASLDPVLDLHTSMAIFSWES